MDFFPGYHLAVRPDKLSGKATQGYMTPAQDKIPQVHRVLPTRVLPIIFLPGIMGSNLRMCVERQRKLKAENNIAWRPDKSSDALGSSTDTPADRQLRLDPKHTFVDEYDPIGNPTGNLKETSDQRNSRVGIGFFYNLDKEIDGPLLVDDVPGSKPFRTRDQKALERGWGEVYFGSYASILQNCELHLNAAFRDGKMSGLWEQIIGVRPSEWEAHPTPLLEPLEEKTLRAVVKGCWFPVHAMGYNWLQSNRNSGMGIAERITALMKKYHAQGFQCEKVIIVTHSMGGLVARAVIHPDMGNLEEKVLGIVHGVMPAIGAGAAYKRMRCGFEDFPGNPIPKILGNLGEDVTAVLGNAPGGLELLPTQAYGNDWLKIRYKGEIIKSFPKRGDPYEEIYKVDGKIYSLIRRDWINPADLSGPSFENTRKLLDEAKAFHQALNDTYHMQSYAHYGCDRKRTAWHHVVWEIDSKAHVLDVDAMRIMGDNSQGKLDVIDLRHPSRPGELGPRFRVAMQPPQDPGDKTVPLHSADHQARSGKFKGIFRQTGYEHQSSFQNDAVLRSTLYSLVRIAQTMRWSK